ncbi:MAG: thiamine phosphate synthase, partial [Planctomycetes bacterium]|nr:thiamine phosphate synthase [Planctomycetota bacterium]
MLRDFDADRERLCAARLMLLFTPELCGARDPLAVLGAAFPHVDVVQVRPKPLGGAGEAPCDAALVLRWTRAVLELRARLGASALVLVDDRVDAAELLLAEGVSGVHLGQDDCPVRIARERLGAGPLVGWSTHTLDQVVEADELPVDYLGFGPVNATTTKGYARGLGAEAAWIASRASSFPIFPIGGIGRENAQELARV